jgi:hypothetical protein
MAIHTELELRLPNSPGALAGVCRLLAQEHVNIVAMALDNHGRLRLVADAGINVDYAYGAGAEGAETAAIVLGVEEAWRAAVATGI